MRLSEVSMRKNILQYDAVVFDMDGTLYHQRMLRILMGSAIAGYVLFHPWRVQDIAILLRYRYVREHWDTKVQERGDLSMEEEQFRKVAERMRISHGKVRSTVRYWMHERPLSLLANCADGEIKKLFLSVRKRGMKAAVYSDYPAQEKLAALGLLSEYVFTSSDPDIGCMKPNPAGMRTVLGKLGLSADQVLMIGDRMEKDGLAAKNTGMDYVILPKSMPARRKLYKKLFVGLTP